MKRLILLFTIISSQVMAQELKQSADSLYGIQEWEMASKSYEDYLRENHKDSSAWYNLGKSYFNLKQYDKAIKNFTKAKETNFSINFVSYSMSKAYALMKNESKMLEALSLGAKNGLPIYTRLKNDAEFEQYRNNEEFNVILEQVKNNAYPCLTGEKYRHFDFWIGEWDVYVNESKVGENLITVAQGGCAIHENYTTVGNYAGQSINYYDPIGKKWHQHWVGSGGDVYNYLETKRDKGMLQFESDFMGPKGKISLSRLTFTLNENGTVRQLFESSTDDGKSWSSAFDGIYKKKTKK